MHWEVTSTLAQVHSGSFTAPSSPSWRIDQCSATSAFPITRNISLLFSCSWLSCFPFLCIPQKRASDWQWDHELELQLSIVVLHYSAASSCISSCLPIPKLIISREEALPGSCDSGSSHRCLLQLGHFWHRPVPALSASNCHGNKNSPFY